MRQINNNNLQNAISFMKTLPAFDSFIGGCERRLEKLSKDGSFKFKTKNSSGKQISNILVFSREIAMSSYLNLLKNNIRKIITCDSIELQDWKQQFDDIDISTSQKNKKKAFFDKIQLILQYKTLRSGDEKLLFKFYDNLNVKVCVYCNSQHVILLKSSEIARFQADHNLPKSKYPCFSVSLANLYPSCNNCNHLKFEENINFQLYHNTSPINELNFSLNKIDIVNFLQNNIKESSLKIFFDQGSTTIDDILKVEEIYENHKDYAADLIRKYKIYSSSYLSQLTSSFNTIFGNNPTLLNRMIFGATLNEEDINQRVFSKLTIDLKKQLDELNRKKII